MAKYRPAPRINAVHHLTHRLGPVLVEDGSQRHKPSRPPHDSSVRSMGEFGEEIEDELERSVFQFNPLDIEPPLDL